MAWPEIVETIVTIVYIKSNSAAVNARFSAYRLNPALIRRSKANVNTALEKGDTSV